MSTTTDYAELLPAIQAIPTERVLIPNMPVSIFVQEAEDLYHWCLADQVALTGAGLVPGVINTLQARAGACREAQSLWIKERNTRMNAEQIWAEQSPAAFDLRNHLVHGFRYAFRNDPVLLARVDEIAQGNSNADMVQDLNDLSVLGKANLPLLTVVGITDDELDQAAETADLMGDVLGATNGERDATSPAMIVRDKAYTYLKQSVDEIRACGKFVFWKNPDRLKGYNSDFWRAHKKSTTEKEETPA
jgi:hypothetical protein